MAICGGTEAGLSADGVAWPRMPTKATSRRKRCSTRFTAGTSYTRPYSITTTSSSAMTRKDMLSTWTEGDDIIGVHVLPRDVHPRRAHRHPGNRKSTHAARLLGKDALHVGNRDMTLECHAVYTRFMAG